MIAHQCTACWGCHRSAAPGAISQLLTCRPLSCTPSQRQRCVCHLENTRTYERGPNLGARQTAASALQSEPDLPAQKHSGVARTLVIAVDESQESLAAFRWVVNNIYRQGDYVRLLHVLPRVRERLASGSVYYAPPLASEDCDYDSQMEHITQTFLREAKRLAVADCSVDLIRGSDVEGVGEVLCRRAEELGAAVLVLHSHRKSAIQHVLLGSVSTFCATHCARPVLLVH